MMDIASQDDANLNDSIVRAYPDLCTPIAKSRSRYPQLDVRTEVLLQTILYILNIKTAISVDHNFHSRPVLTIWQLSDATP